MKTVLSALWSARTWRATLHALVAVPLAIATTGFLGGAFVLWGAAVVSLVQGAEGDWWLPVLYITTAVAGPVILLWWVRAFGALHRARINATLGVEIAAPPSPSVTPRTSWARAWMWVWAVVRPWGSVVTWRLVGYHALVPFLLIGGGLAVAASWTGAVLALRTGAGATAVITGVGLILAAPWVARGVARLDVAAARTLLGPSPTEALALRVDALARSRTEVIEAADAERRRIERDLHDGAQQRLVSLAMNLGMARAALTDAPPEVRLVIEQAHDEATQALAELREIVRGLHPAVLNDRGLDAALSGIAARAPLPVKVRVDAPRCSPTVEAVAFFVVSEALTNVAKHARATRATVTVDQVVDRLRIVVTDDGVGGAAVNDGGGAAVNNGGGAAVPTDGSGLRGLRQRAASVDGTLTIDSPIGGPTTLTVELPCES